MSLARNEAAATTPDLIDSGLYSDKARHVRALLHLVGKNWRLFRRRPSKRYRRRSGQGYNLGRGPIAQLVRAVDSSEMVRSVSNNRNERDEFRGTVFAQHCAARPAILSQARGTPREGAETT